MDRLRVFEKATLKDKVYSLLHGVGEVIKVEDNLIDIFFEDGASITVDFDGNEFPNQKNPSIQWYNCRIIFKKYRLRDVIELLLIKKPYLQCKNPIYLYYGEYPGGGYNEKWQISELCGKKFNFHFENTEDANYFVELLNKGHVNDEDMAKAFIELEWI